MPVHKLRALFGMIFAFAACMGVARDVTAADLEVQLVPEFDLFGNQVEVVQGYNWNGQMALAFGIYDTGASVVTLSAADRAAFELQGASVPIKVPGGAVADAIDGVITGDVSMPMTFWADGLHAVTFSWVSSTLEIDFSYDLSGGASVPGVQVFVGTEDGSPQLPNVAGTPIHFGSVSGGAVPAAKIDMMGYAFDLGDFFSDDPFLGPLFAGVVMYMPDVSFVAAGTRLLGLPGVTTDPVRIPLSLFGPDNYANPGDEVTVAPNPVQEQVQLQNDLATVTDAVFLFDTGASISVISTAVAEQLGLDLNSPVTTIDIVGAAGSPITVPGFNLDALSLPIDSDFDGTIDGVLRFLDAPVFVVDLVEGLDGILGMNLWNPAKELLYDPNDPLGPSLQVTFLSSRDLPTDDEGQLIESLGEVNPLFGQLFGIGGGPVYFPPFRMQPAGGGEVIPEPAAVWLLLLGGGTLTACVRSRRSKAKALAV